MSVITRIRYYGWYRPRNWTLVRLLELVCMVRGHEWGQWFTCIGSDPDYPETPWCSRCGKEAR